MAPLSDDEEERQKFRQELLDALRQQIPPPLNSSAPAIEMSDEEKRKLKFLLENYDDIKKILDSRKVTIGVYSAIGEFSKWIIAVIGAIIAWKTFFSGGGGAK